MRCCCCYCDGSETENNKGSLGSFKLFTEPESSLGEKDSEGGHMPRGHSAPDQNEKLEAVRVKTVFTEGTGVLGDQVKLGGKTERQADLGLRRNPGGGCPLEKSKSSDMFRSENFRISVFVPPLVLSPSHCPQTQGFFVSWEGECRTFI